MKRTQRLALLLILPTPLWAQHDPGRNATRLLAKGETDQAIQLVAKPPKRMNSPISEAARGFVLTMAACKQGDVEAAFKHAQKAVQNGLPIERLQAGPRDALAPLFATQAFESWLKTKQQPLLHGPLLGSVTDTSASFWVRTAGEADVQVVVHPLGNTTVVGKPLSGKARSSASNDYTATVRVSGLKPMTRYRYQVSVDQEQTGTPADFETFPKQNTASRFSIAFGGGAGFTPQYERMWTTIGTRDRITGLETSGVGGLFPKLEQPILRRWLKTTGMLV
jgi:alkaline phosphatase D